MSFKTIKSKFTTLVAVSVVLMLPLSIQAENSDASFDGLVLKKSDDFDEVYMAPDINFKEYKNVILEAGTVSFRKNWERDYERKSRTRISDRDLNKIKDRTMSILMDVFTKAVEKNDNFKLTSEKGENTLLVKPSIIKLDVYAPDIDRPSRSRSYVREAGVATLYLEVFDSETGEILARIVDKKRGRDNGWMQEANRVTNTHDARVIFKSWAKRLNEQLEKVE